MEITDVDYSRPSKAPRLRVPQDKGLTPKRHPQGTSRIPRKRSTEAPEIQTPSVESVVSLFTLIPTTAGETEEVNITEVIPNPHIPHDWSFIIASKSKVQVITNPDTTVVRKETLSAPPLKISQDLLDKSIVSVEEEMAKLRSEKKFGSDLYIQQQMIRERMLDAYRHASEAF